MLIDDDYATNLFHQITITDANLAEELVICSSVDDAYDQLNQMEVSPDFIFLDMNMPLKNAWDFLEVYDAEKYAKTKVVILSTTKNPEDVEKANNNSKVFGFLTKPLDLEFLKSYAEENQLNNKDLLDK